MLTKFIFAVLVCTSFGAVLPPSFKTCKRTDPAYNECLRTAIQESLALLANGNAELGVVPISPLTIPTATIGEGKGAVNVVQNYKDFKLMNLLSINIDKVESTITPDNKAFQTALDVSTPELNIDADYDFNGRVLLLPIVGKGKCLLTLKNLKAKIILNVELYEKKGTTYTRVKECKVELNPGRVIYRFDNLFNGDERLGKEMNNILNDNWKDVFDDIKPGYEELIGTVFKGLSNSIFTKIPYDEIYPK